MQIKMHFYVLNKYIDMAQRIVFYDAFIAQKSIVAMNLCRP